MSGQPSSFQDTLKALQAARQSGSGQEVRQSIRAAMAATSLFPDNICHGGISAVVTRMRSFDRLHV